MTFWFLSNYKLQQILPFFIALTYHCIYKNADSSKIDEPTEVNPISIKNEVIKILNEYLENKSVGSQSLEKSKLDSSCSRVKCCGIVNFISLIFVASICQRMGGWITQKLTHMLLECHVLFSDYNQSFQLV